MGSGGGRAGLLGPRYPRVPVGSLSHLDTNPEELMQHLRPLEKSVFGEPGDGADPLCRVAAQ